MFLYNPKDVQMTSFMNFYQNTLNSYLEDCNEDAINDALRNYGFLVQYVRLIEE
jgi:hypothetical protein